MNTEQPLRWLVLKFGGTSVASAANWAVIRDLVRERLNEGYRPLVVHSAVGGVSSQLEELLELATAGTHEPLRDEIVARHIQLAKELGLDGEVLLQESVEELGQLLRVSVWFAK